MDSSKSASKAVVPVKDWLRMEERVMVKEKENPQVEEVVNN